jgi:hypothetical protein
MTAENEMVERVAKALAAAFKARIAKSAGMPFEETGVVCPHDEIWTEYARAAITATREPTEPMAYGDFTETLQDPLIDDLE